MAILTARQRILATLSARGSLHGFTLIELAVVVFLMGIMLTLGITAFTAQMDSAAYSSTQKKQETIKDALVTYLRVNRRLPCPETTGLPGAAPVTLSGRENRQNTLGTPPQPDLASSCSSYVGTVPWLDLGLAKDVALDGYGNFFTYFVSSAAENSDPDWTRTAAPGAVTGFSVGSPGRFAITNNGQATSVDSGFNPLPPLAAVVLVSHGKNGFGAITEKGTRNVDSADADELANKPPTAPTPVELSWSPQVPPYNALGMVPPAVTATLVSGSIAAGNTYDDIVLVLRPNDLLAPIIKDGAMKSPQAQISDSFARIKTALASYAFATTNLTWGSGTCDEPGITPYCRLLPPASSGMVPTIIGLPSSDGTDLWGRTIRYVPVPSIATPGKGGGLSKNSPTTGNTAYTLSSDGPDRIQDTSDDISVTVSLVELRMMIGTTYLP